MKVSKEKAAEHRAAIVAVAGRLFRERGFDRVGVAEITKAAGLTHGGFYGHFQSKDALAAEACDSAFEASVARLRDDEASPDGVFHAFLDRYLSERHRDRPDAGCPMATLAMEVGQQDPTVQARFATGVDRYIEEMLSRLPETPGEPRARAIALVSALVGGMALARAVAQADPDLSVEILTALRGQLGGSEG